MKMKYYIQIKNNSVLSYSNLPVIDEDIINQEVSKDTYNEYIEHNNYYFVENNKLIRKTNKQIEDEKQQQEKERIANLTCTKRVFVLLLEQLGLDYFEQIEPLINANRQARLEWELASTLLRSNSLINNFATKLGITEHQIDILFEVANNEKNIEELKATVKN